jgi:hypothetical protein
MRPGQQNKRGRGRGNNGGGNGGGNPNGGGNNNNFNRKGSNPLTRTYDSSGPDVKIRGTAQHIAEKYTTLARDSQSAGDRVMAENYLQHAEHYYRIIAAAQAQMQERFQREDRQDFNERDGADRDLDEMDGSELDEQPMATHGGQHRNQQQQRPHHQQQPQPQPQPQAPAAAQPEVTDTMSEASASAASDQPQTEAPASSRQPQGQRPPRTPRAYAPRGQAPGAAVIDGTGPQPEIVGIPAEVAIEEAQGTEEPRQPRRRTPSARTPSARPRRQRRSEGGEENGSDTAPDLADATSE